MTASAKSLLSPSPRAQNARADTWSLLAVPGSGVRNSSARMDKFKKSVVQVSQSWWLFEAFVFDPYVFDFNRIWSTEAARKTCI